MPLTDGEKYGVFLLLTAEKSNLRLSLVASCHGAAAAAVSAGNDPIAAVQTALPVAVAGALPALGVSAANITGVPLGLLFDQNDPNYLTTNQHTIAQALQLAYSGDCPPRATQSQIIAGIKSTLG